MACGTMIASEFDQNSRYLQKFRLYETCSNFYMVGRDKNRTFWRVLKIDRLEQSELSIHEDSTVYAESECQDLLRRIHEGNRSTGGLKFVTNCYGIVGFIKFLGPYYMLLITKRRTIGTIWGQTIYAIAKSEMITIPHPTVRSKMTNSKNENRYKKLLCTVDLTKDFFFSYSYNIMHSLQKNLCNNDSGQGHYDTLFVWNEFLTQGIRNNLKNTLWTVALVYGFFKQVKLSVAGRDFKLTLIARRSRHYAGTRYLKRGVNEKGRVANDVETEQIVLEDVHEGCPEQSSSVVQNRGSIPLFWSQETSRLNLKPDIILSKKDINYEATKLHFQNLVKRYGNPIIILNLIKTREKKPRETVLRAEFANAIRYINKGLYAESRLRFLHLDLNKYSRNKSINVLALLGRVADYALNLTGIFYCTAPPNLVPEQLTNPYNFENVDLDVPAENNSSKSDTERSWESEVTSATTLASKNDNLNVLMVQKGILRTNCIDCLDRTNVAQYAYGLVALGRQLHVLGFVESPNIDMDNPLTEDLMKVYETMGDTLALQYGGSPAHNKIFSQRRGQWKAATQSQEFLRTLQRYYSNAYMDAEKQDAINVFLGHFQPQEGKPALWELDSDQHHNIERRGPFFVDENSRLLLKRSLSDGNILNDGDTPLVGSIASHKQLLPERSEVISESTPEISSCDTELSSYPRSGGVYCSRYTPSMSRRRLFRELETTGQCLESEDICYDEHGYACDCSNFLDMDWISSSGNSCEDDVYDRSTAGLSSENLVGEIKIDSTTESASSLKGQNQTGSSELNSTGNMNEYSESFLRWINYGGMLSK